MLARPLRLYKHDAQPSRKPQEYFSMQVVVTGSFSSRADGRTIGLVTGLANGTNYLVAKHLRGGGGQLKITNDPIGGPILLSSQSSPWVCATGVCEWSKPGVGQQPAQSPVNFSAGPSGVPFPPAPVTTRIGA
jgi:uncharacterized tannase-like protein DUF6351